MLVVSTSDWMKLEQTIPRSQKSMGGTISQTNQQNYVREWEIAYYKILSISNLFKEITNKSCELSNEFTQHHELEGNLSKEIELAVQKLVAFITRRGNPYSTSNTVTELYNISTMQIYNQQVAEQYTNFSKNSISRYQNFRRDRYIEKSVSLGPTITKSNLPSLKEKLKKKTTTISNTNNIRKEMEQAQRSIDIARSRKILLRDILTYDHTVYNLKSSMVINCET